MFRKALLAAALVSGFTATPALAKGCIRGAIVGGVAGHYVGRGHALAGAAAGCLVARHHYAQKAKAQRTSPRR